MTTYIMNARPIPLHEHWDVIVVGGGPAGCTAATAAAREGAKTLLVEAAGALGGMGTLGLVPWFCGYSDGKRIIAQGLAKRILDVCRDNTPHLKKIMEQNPFCPPSIDPELLKRIYDDMVTELGVETLFHTQLCAVETAGDQRVDAILLSNKKGINAYRAKIYIDCTGDGDLAAWAGCAFEKGDASGAMQPATHCFTITNIDEYGLENGPRVHFYDPDSPIHKAIQSDKYPLIKELHSCNRQIGPGTYGFNTGHVFDVDNTDPASVSKALMHGRQMAHQYLEAFKEFHPAFANAMLAATGALLGARETRRILGDYVLTVEDYLARRSFPDEICRNAYNIDVHGSKKQAQDAAKKNIQEVKQSIEKQIRSYTEGESFGVPYRCLTPRGVTNILTAGRCISSDRQVNGSVRIMACCLTTGEAAGIAAAMAADDSQDVHCVNTDQLRQKLKNHGAYLP